VEQQSIYQLLGGFPGVLRLAHAWHKRVLADEVVAHAFSHGFHPQHTDRLAAYWAEAWGGPEMYTGQIGSESSVVRMHSGNGEHEEMDRRAIQCFAAAMDDVEIDRQDLRDALLAYFTWATTVRMASFPKKDAAIPESMSLVRWSLGGRV
jgi:hemoglobin